MTYNFSNIEDLTLSNGILYVTDTIFSITMAVGLGANIITILTILRTKHLQSPMNVSLVSLAITDLFVCVVVIPLRLCLNNVYLDETSLTQVCTTLVFMKSFCDYAEPCMLVATSYERYQSIAKPFESRNKQKRIVVISASTGIVCSGFASVSVTEFHDGSLIYPCHHGDSDRHTLLFREGFVTLPFGVLCILVVSIFYILMIRLLRQHSKSFFKKTKPLKDRIGLKNKVKPANIKDNERENVKVIEPEETTKHTTIKPEEVKQDHNSLQHSGVDISGVQTEVASEKSDPNCDKPTAESTVQTQLSSENRQEYLPENCTPNTDSDDNIRKLSIYVTREYILKPQRRMTVANDAWTLIARKLKHKEAFLQDNNIQKTLVSSDSKLITKDKNDRNDRLQLHENVYTTDQLTTDSEPAYKLENQCNSSDQVYNPLSKDSSANSSSDLLHYQDLHTNAADNSIKNNVNTFNCSVNMQIASTVDSTEEPFKPSEEGQQQTGQSDAATSETVICESSKLTENNAIKVNCIDKANKESPCHSSGQTHCQTSSSKQEEELKSKTLAANKESHLTFLKNLTENTHLKLGSKLNNTANLNTSSTTFGTVENSGLAPTANDETKNILNNVQENVTPGSLANVDIVDFDGTVHKNVLVEGPVCGAVCVMNPTNRVAGRRKVEMRAAKRIAVLIGSFAALWLLLPITALVISNRKFLTIEDVETLLITSSISSITVVVNPVLNLLLNKQLRSASVSLFKQVMNHCKKQKL